MIEIDDKNDVFFIENDSIYYITSHPYEPCIYIKKEDKIVAIIHNSFTTCEIIDVSRGKYKITAISGKEYDIEEISNLFSYVLNNNLYEADISYIEQKLNKKKIELNEIKFNEINNIEEKQIKNELNNVNIKELTDDIFYKEYKKYDECVLDYCIIKVNTKYNLQESHKDAVIYAMEKWKKVTKDEYDMEIDYNKEKMKATKLDSKDFFGLSTKHNCKENISYCYLFLHPPHGCSYNINDFVYLNKILFPNGFNDLDIYNWSTDWSNYFEEGLEWWGAKCISIYDKFLDRFVVIGASATD